jgi:hypothetical protein
MITKDRHVLHAVQAVHQRRMVDRREQPVGGQQPEQELEGHAGALRSKETEQPERECGEREDGVDRFGYHASRAEDLLLAEAARRIR